MAKTMATAVGIVDVRIACAGQRDFEGFDASSQIWRFVVNSGRSRSANQCQVADEALGERSIELVKDAWNPPVSNAAASRTRAITGQA